MKFVGLRFLNFNTLDVSKIFFRFANCCYLRLRI